MTKGVGSGETLLEDTASVTRLLSSSRVEESAQVVARVDIPQGAAAAAAAATGTIAAAAKIVVPIVGTSGIVGSPSSGAVPGP